MAKPSSSNTILEERKDFMVSPFGDSKPALRKAYFLKPTATSMEEPELPSDSISQLSPQTLQRDNCPLKSSSMSWVHPQQDWITWVSRMQSKHQAAWKKSGIDQAILNSTYDIKKSIELIIGLSEKWCPNTNTFVFPWGEATITLEDVIILGGYSVLGSPVSCFVENREWEVIEEKLMDARMNITREIAWMNYNKPTSDTKLYIPSRLSESNVTTRYLKWWEQMVLGKNKKVSGSSQHQRSAKRSKPDLQVSKGEKTSIDPDVPPGFRPKNNMNVSRISAKKDKPAAVEMLAGNNQQSFGNEVIANGELRGQSQCNFTSKVHDGTDRNMEPPSQSAQNISGGEATMGAAGRATDQTGSWPREHSSRQYDF
ncbi:PROTEIN MAIN-LIKE 2 [Salix purpurea]|uniref:PROTEIN MAIN-LIKE 2 n=1 Tax=Salix purpurea TaxID=77065 RepID=A0A9Q0VS72_SALPP|nr:PROTEIN MAIN-LIKE 2 [Salix purpurea]